jgi:hypothetical protein
LEYAPVFSLSSLTLTWLHCTCTPFSSQLVKAGTSFTGYTCYTERKKTRREEGAVISSSEVEVRVNLKKRRQPGKCGPLPVYPLYSLDHARRLEK